MLTNTLCTNGFNIDSEYVSDEHRNTADQGVVAPVVAGVGHQYRHQRFTLHEL